MGTAAVTGGAGRFAPRDGEDVEVDVLACTRLEGSDGAAGWARRGRCWKETLREGAVDVIAGPHWSTRSLLATLPVAKARDMMRWELRILPERGRYVDVDGAAVVMLGGNYFRRRGINERQ